MADTTPAMLALELGISQRRIRDVLRERYGTLPADESRWLLTDDQAGVVRQHFRDAPRVRAQDWPLEIGAEVTRRSLHAALGGSRQNGIAPLRSRSDVLIFSKVDSASRFGYHHFEGLQADGSFAYTGEGQRGDQEFVRGNRIIRDAAAEGRPLRLFTVRGTRATYAGEFTTGVPTYRTEQIPDASGMLRDGIIFNLVPVDGDLSLLEPADAPTDASARIATWSPPDAADFVVAGSESPLDERTVSRIEFQLQADFGEWLRSRGTPATRLVLTTGAVNIEPDHYVEARGWIVEAKKSSAREYVRSALGQVLDYVNLAEMAGVRAKPVILLPGLPAPDLRSLLRRYGVTLVTRDGEDFRVQETVTA